MTKAKSTKLMVTAALLVDKGRLLIAQRKKTDRLAHKWEFPGGKIEVGETPQECLAREIKEEFGIEIAVGDYFDTSIYHYEQGTIELLAYWATPGGGVLRPTAHDAYEWVTPAELSRYNFAPADIPLVAKLKIMKL